MEKNSKGVIVLLIVVILALTVLCTLFATGAISLKSNDIETENQPNENTTIDKDDEPNLLDSNIIITQNGKVISNEIPSDLVGKYINRNSNESYIKLDNESVEISEPTGGNATRIYKDDQVKLYINFLNIGANSTQYVTVEFYVENNGYDQKETYTYIGEKSSHDNEYHFKTPNPTPSEGEGKNDYPYSK